MTFIFQIKPASFCTIRFERLLLHLSFAVEI